jgi:hypothetical protein
MKKLFYMHIGMAKTATSSLQQFFNDNNKRFMRYNIIYPQNGRVLPRATNHFRLYFCFMEQDHHLCPPNIEEAKFEWQKVMNEVINTGFNVLISSEAFINLKIEHFYNIRNYVGNNYNLILTPLKKRVDKTSPNYTLAKKQEV